MTAFTAPDLYRSEAFAEDLNLDLLASPQAVPATQMQSPLTRLLMLAWPLAMALAGATLSVVAPLS